MSLFDALRNWGDRMETAKAALASAEKTRRERTREALVKFAGSTRTVNESDLDAILAASSQAGAVKEIARQFGFYDLLRGLIDRLEGK